MAFLFTKKKGTQKLHQPTGRVVSAGKFIGDFDPQDPRWWGFLDSMVMLDLLLAAFTEILVIGFFCWEIYPANLGNPKIINHPNKTQTVTGFEVETSFSHVFDHFLFCGNNALGSRTAL